MLPYLPSSPDDVGYYTKAIPICQSLFFKKPIFSYSVANSFSKSSLEKSYTVSQNWQLSW